MLAYFLTGICVLVVSTLNLMLEMDGDTSSEAMLMKGILFGTGLFITLISALISTGKVKDPKAKRTVFGIYALIWGILYFLLKYILIVGLVIIGVIVAAAFLTDGQIFRSFFDMATSGTSSSNRESSERDDLEERREAIKQAVIHKYGLHPSEVHVNSTADMVNINGEWKKVSDL